MLTTYDLTGVWDFSMAQMAKGTCPTAFDDTISLPGTTSLAKKGTPNPNRETGFLTDAYAFEGQAWFHKTVYVRPDLLGLPMKLTLERTRLTTLWINGKRVGSCDSLCTPHVYDISGYVTKPLVDITILVENTGYPTKGGHLTSPDTQSNWNGITGEIKLEVFPEVYVDHIQAYPSLEEKNVTLIMQLHGAKTAVFSADGITCEENEEDIIPPFQAQITADETGKASVTIPLGETIYAWSEYSPALYLMTYRVNEQDVGTLSFGLRQFCADGNRFTINGQPTMLRGKHDGMIFPRTGYAPTDVNEWISVLQTAKDYGINHYRFHTCCPPDAAFTAADILGIYMEPELPFWGTLTAKTDENHNEAEQQYLIELGDKMLEVFGNHPSFVMFSLGNELWGNPERIGEILRHYKSLDDRHLYTQGCNNFQHFPLILPEDDYFVGVRLSKERLIRGSYGMCDAPLGHVQTDRPSTMHNYDNIIFPQQTEDTPADDVQEIEIQYGTGVKKVKVSKSDGGLIPTKPVITHEIGQYEVYPDFHEIEKYTGPLKARNFEIFRERLAAKGMLSQADDFFRCSGALAAACYKEEIEAAMRSQYVAGFQLLDLQDFSGQGTALVGMLDAFMESKGLITPEEWRMFCSDCVLLAQFPSYVCITGEMFVAKVSLRTTLPTLPQHCTAEWLMVTENGETLGEGSFLITAESAGLIEVGSIFCRMPEETTHPLRMHLILSITDTDVCNAYDLMLYPAIGMPSLESREDLCITENLEEALAQLEKGGRVLYLPTETAQSIPGFYCTDFWCYPMFRDICNWMNKPVAVGTMGLCIQADHAALAQFPTQEYSTPQWYDIVSNADCAILDETPEGFTPIVQMIDNFERNHKLGIVWEAKVGSGSLLVCTSRLSSIATRPEVRWFAKSLLAYAVSEAFQPEQEMTAEQLRRIFGEKEKPEA
ncbi:MAG: glycoside hydrolase family 2 TIM barrel-domain containing protein [Ruminococcus sp.]